MNEIVKKPGETGLTIARPNTAVELRRRVVTEIEVARALSATEKLILVASTKTLLSEMADSELVRGIRTVFEQLRKDLGVREAFDEFDYTRFFDILRKYYNGLALSEIKLAFELLMTGNLDDYLPKDSNGEPEKKHYQLFNVDFLTRILNAYRKKQQEVVTKAVRALPPTNPITEEQAAECSRAIYDDLKAAFVKYKYTGVFPRGIDAMAFHRILLNNGLLFGVPVTEEDRQRALNKLVSQIATGKVRAIEGQQIIREKDKAEQVQNEAFWMRADKNLKTTFDVFIKYEFQFPERREHLTFIEI